MKTFVTISIFLFSSILSAQSSLIVFSELDEKFVATLNGEKLNNEPASRIEKHDFMQEFGKILIQLDDASKGIVSKNLFLEPNTEYLYILKLSKKGKYVLRLVSSRQIDHQTVVYTSDNYVAEPQHIEQSKESNNQYSGDNVNTGTLSLNVNGTEISMTIASESASNSIAETSIDQTSKSYTQSPLISDNSNQISNCGSPTSDIEFDQATASIKSQSFEDTKLAISEELAKNSCFTSTQIKKIMEHFSFEESKLNFAKYAYQYCFDSSNYYQVFDAFTFESSISNLKEHINK